MLQPVTPLKILILAVYWNRPLLVRNALASVVRADARHHNWVLAFGDDGSEVPGEPIAREILHDHLDRVSFYNTHQTIEDKVRHGITIGRLANQVLGSTDAEVCITLCDDDELHPDYLWNLSRYFSRYREARYCWSNIHLYNPLRETSEGVDNLAGIYNEARGPVEPYGRLDGSQVAFRVSALHEHNLWYRDTTKSSRPDQGERPWAYNLDGELFKGFHQAYGPCPYTGFVSQYKGVHDRQLVFHKEHVFRGHEDIFRFHRDVLARAGKEF